MRIFTLVLFLILSPWVLALPQNPEQIDPDLIDPEMIHVMYVIKANDLKISAYRSGSPSALDLKLCSNCSIKTYHLAENAELLMNENPLLLSDLTISLIKKKFDVIQLGIDRSNHTVTYLYLGGISESSAEELAQELSDEN